MLSNRLANQLTRPLTFLSRKLPDTGTKIVVHLHRPLVGHQLLTLEHEGFKILIDPNDNCGGRLYYWGSYEPEQTAVFKELLEELRPDTFLDVGANIGYYSLLAASCSRAQIYSFEPSPRIANCLQRSIALNGFETRITQIRKAAGKERGSLAFYVNENPHNFGLGSIVNTVSGSSEVVVECCAVDDEIHLDPGTSVLCKIDIEGAEFGALQGMQRILTSIHPTLIVEVHTLELKKAGSSAREVFDLLQCHGYSLHTLEGKDEVVDFDALPDAANYWLLGRWSAAN